MLATLAFIAAGGFCGGISRYLATTKIHTLWGVVVANLLAGFLLGLLTTAPTQPWLLLFAGTGCCGALSTWSTAAKQFWETWRSNKRLCLAYSCSSLAGGLLATALGVNLGAIFLG